MFCLIFVVLMAFVSRRAVEGWVEWQMSGDQGEAAIGLPGETSWQRLSTFLTVQQYHQGLLRLLQTIRVFMSSQIFKIYKDYGVFQFNSCQLNWINVPNECSTWSQHYLSSCPPDILIIGLSIHFFLFKNTLENCNSDISLQTELKWKTITT